MKRDFNNGERVAASDGLGLISQFVEDYESYLDANGDEAALDAARGYLSGLEATLEALEYIING